MHTRSNTVWTAMPHPTRHARALPTAAGHRQCSDDAPPRTRSAVRYIVAVCRPLMAGCVLRRRGVATIGTAA